MWRKMECDDTLQWMTELTNTLSLIVSGTSDDITKGWENLRKLDENDVFENYSSNDEALSLTSSILRGEVKNIREVPKLMSYFAKYVKKKQKDEEDSMIDDYVFFVENCAVKDVALLVETVRVLEDSSMYGASDVRLAKACRVIVTCLGSFQMPNGPNEAMAKFRESADKIKESLRVICKSRDDSGNSDLTTVCLETVYKMISNNERTIKPGPGLIAILELVEIKYVNQAVKWIMSEPRSDSQLERALEVLCHWIPNSLRLEHLSRWIIEFMSGLEIAKKYDILNRVADAHLKNILVCVMLPMSNYHATILATIMLYSQPNPLLFHQVVKLITMIFVQLKKQENNYSALRCAQNLVDVTKALVERFPGYKIYDNLEKSFPVKPQIRNVLAYRNKNVWSDDYERISSDNAIACSIDDHGKIGLENLGNTCYVNSVLQALAMTRQFSREVMRYESPEDNKKNDDSASIAASAEEAARIMPKLRNFFALLFYSKRKTLSPNEILVASRPEYFTPKQQQDSSEFLCHLLDVLYEQEKNLVRKSSSATEESGGTRTKGKRSSETTTIDRGIKRWTTEEDLSEGISLERKTSQSLGDFSQGNVDEPIGQTQAGETLSDCHSDSTDSGIQSVDGNRGRSDAMIDETTDSQSILVHRVFGGKSKITYQCAQCDTSSHNTDRFRDLQLCFPEEITDNQEVSVQDLMNYYLTPEKLTGDNKYRCDKCTKLCDAQRIIKILQAPIHLILTLKHFHYDPETRLRTKLRHKVTYNETIKLPVSSSDPVSSSPIAETYRLYAAVVHSGYSMDYGHYVTYARDSKQDWFKFDDSFVYRTSLDDFNALEPPITPYILFYEKISTIDGCCYADGDEEKPKLSTLGKHIQDLVENDCRAYEEEIKHQADKKRIQLASTDARVVAPFIRRHDNSDDENPPPSSYRGPIDIPANRFLY